jgi:phospholipase C
MASARKNRPRGGGGGGGTGLPPNLSTGDLIRFSRPPHVPFPTYAMQSGKRRRIADQNTFDQFGFDANTIQTLTISSTSIPEGPTLTLNEIGAFVLERGHPTPIHVMIIGTLSRVPDQATTDAINASRSNADKLLLTRTAPASEFAVIPQAEDLVSLASGGLYQDYNDRDPRADPTPHIGNVYYADGTYMRWIPDELTFNSLGLSWGNVIATDEFSGLALLGLIGPNMPSVADDNVYVGPDGNAYLMQGGKRRRMPDPQTVAALDPTTQSVSQSDLDQIPIGVDLAPIHVDHVVVLVLENRSFDHILGDMAQENPEIDGIRPGTHFSNPRDMGPGSQIFPVRPVADYVTGLDPGHELANVNDQLSPTSADGQGQPFRRDHLTNSGFVYDYTRVIAENNAADVAAESVMNYFERAMLPKLTQLARGFAVCDAWFSSVPGPTMPNRFFLHTGTAAGYAKSPFQDTKPDLQSLLRDLSSLAAVSAAGSSPASLLQTLMGDPNQLEGFILQVLKANYIRSDPEANLLFNTLTNSIYELLEANGKQWTIYFQDLTEALFIPWLRSRLMDELTIPFDDEGFPTAPSTIMNSTGNFRTFHKFLEDARAGNLPFYSFVTPRYGRSPDLRRIFEFLAAKINAIHNEEAGEFGDIGGEDVAIGFSDAMQLIPLVSTSQPGTDAHPPNDVRDCENFIADVYNAIKNSPNWERTVLIVLFDEHGGFFDHVRPPEAKNTDPQGRVYDGNTPGFRQGKDPTFAFDLLGLRVPALVISPFIEWNTVNHHIYDHVSLLSAVTSLAGIPGDIYPHRFPQGLSFFRVLTRQSARTGGDLPAL